MKIKKGDKVVRTGESYGAVKNGGVYIISKVIGDSVKIVNGKEMMYSRNAFKKI